MSDTTSAQHQSALRFTIESLVINGALPYLVYHVLHQRLGSLAALSVAALIPTLSNALSLARYRRLDMPGIFSLATLVLSIGVLLADNERLILLRGSLLSGAIGGATLCSLLLPRPLSYYIALSFAAGNDPQRCADFAALWAYPYFRFTMRLITTVWGMVTLGATALEVYLLRQLSTAEFLAIAPLIGYGVRAATIGWTFWYMRHAQRRGAALAQQTGE